MDPLVHVNRLDEWPEMGSLAPGLEEAARRALRAGRRARDREAPGGTAGREGGAARDEVSITCLPLGEMTELNREHLGRAGPTDVIAFDLGGEGSSGEGVAVLGDIYVAPEMAVRAARSGEAASPREEMVRLVVHGVLHVLGFIHPEIDDRWDSPMYRLQEEVVESLIDEVAEDGGEENEG